MHAPNNLSFNSLLHSIVVSLRRTGSIFGRFQASRDERESSAERSPAKRKITPVLQAICGQLRFHDTLAISPLVVVRDSGKEQCYIYIFYYSWSRSMWSVVLWPRNTCSVGLNGVVASVNC